MEVHDRRRSYDTQYPLLSASAHSNLHIFDSQADHIVVVGPDGSLIRTVGGRGEGPGEFDNVTTAIVGRDGSYTVM